MRVANTAFLMVYEPAAKTYYLKGGEEWLSSANHQGPWEEVQTLPAPVKALEDQLAKAKPAAGQTAPKQVTGTGDQRPAIVVSTVPTELLVTQGEPEYTPITGTNLLYVSNTENTIFMDMATQEHYALPFRPLVHDQVPGRGALELPGAKPTAGGFRQDPGELGKGLRPGERGRDHPGPGSGPGKLHPPDGGH